MFALEKNMAEKATTYLPPPHFKYAIGPPCSASGQDDDDDNDDDDVSTIHGCRVMDLTVARLLES